MIRRRPTQVFSLAFLDCICCGFGAIILVFVLSIGGQDKAKREQLAKLRLLIAAQAADLIRLNASREDIDQSNARVASLVVDSRLRNDSIHSLIDDYERKLSTEKRGQEALLVDIDDLEKEIAARQKKPELVMENVKPAPVGVPIGSNYIAFVVDSSGSMREDNGGPILSVVLRKIEDVLNSYPDVKGIQVLDSNGNFMATAARSTGGWLPDNRETRDNLRRAIRRYDFYSNSDPVPGIKTALTRLYDSKNPEMKMGIYVFGDEFPGTASSVVTDLDKLNPPDETGKYKVTISAVAFPTQITDGGWYISPTGEKMANLMREICYRYGGAFIAVPNL